MTYSSFLVVGADAVGCAVAGALAAAGTDVALVERDSRWPVMDAMPDLLTRGVELRLDLALIGIVDVGAHLEAELSDGRIENYDAIVVTAREGAVVGDAPGRGVSLVDERTDVAAAVQQLTRGQRA